MKKVYAVINKQYIDISTSGGAFLLLSKTLFDQYPDSSVVFGVEFDSSMNPYYGYAKAFEDCMRFCGSKYVYVSPKDCFHIIRGFLEDQCHVLFTGTPCSVDALMKFLTNNGICSENLITVDLICNGTPTNKFWLDYVQWLSLKTKSKVVNFKFRKKGDANNPYLTEATLENGKIIRDSHLTACYNQMFLKKLSIRKTCFSCPYKCEERRGDLTVGDFWGIERWMPHMDKSSGVSQIIVNSKVGSAYMKLIQAMSSDSVIIEECNDSSFVKDQMNLVRNAPFPKDYERFHEKYNAEGIDSVIRSFSDGGPSGTVKYPLRRLFRKMGVKGILEKGFVRRIINK